MSSHSRAPSSRVHGAAGFGRAPPRRRSRSSSASPPRSSAARRDTSCAPRRATLPQPAVFRGSGGRGGRVGRPSRTLSSVGRRRVAPPVRGGPDRAAVPDLGAPDLAAPERGAADLEAPGRGAPVRGPSERAPVGLARPVCPAPLAAGREEVPPPLRPVLARPLADPPPAPLPPRPGAAPRVPLLFVCRRAPPPVPDPPPEPPRDAGGRPPVLLPFPAPPGRAGRADPPDRAEGARRFGWEEF